MLNKKLLALVPAAILAISGTVAYASTSTQHLSTNAQMAKTFKAVEAANNNEIPAAALKTALKGYQWASHRGDVKDHKVITVVDFSVPSSQKRLWVIDLNSHKVLMSMHVARGKNPRFSNAHGSNASSLGVYTMGATYQGEHGYSMHVNGLEAGINNNAASRDIEVHRAWYVTPSFVHKYGRTGRSWGCFALNPARATQLINLTKGGSVLFAYAPAEQHDSNIANV